MRLPSPKERKFHGLIKNITGIAPRDLSLYRLAFLHKSLMQKTKNGIPMNNERLEYLGDAILSGIVADLLFRKFPSSDEGTLSKLRSRIISRGNLNQLSVQLGLVQLIRSQPVAGIVNTHIPGDTLEALIGAIYLDRGYKKSAEFVKDKIFKFQDNLGSLIENDTNFKSSLIEWGQKTKSKIHFVIEEYPGQPPKENSFIAKVFIDDNLAGSGNGSSKKEAQQNAARHALQKLPVAKEITCI